MLAFHTGNDFRNNSRALDANQNRPYFTVDAGVLTLDDAFTDWQKRCGPYHAIISRSVLLQHLDRLRSNLGAAARREHGPGAEHGVDEIIYQAPPNPEWQEAWAITEALLLTVADEVKQRPARLLVVTLSNGIQVHPDPSVPQGFAERLGVDDLFYAERRLNDFGQRHGLSILSLAPEFQRRAEARSVFLHGFNESQPGRGHWNERGHALAGELVARRLCEDLAADPN